MNDDEDETETDGWELYWEELKQKFISENQVSVRFVKSADGETHGIIDLPVPDLP